MACAIQAQPRGRALLRGADEVAKQGERTKHLSKVATGAATTLDQISVLSDQDFLSCDAASFNGMLLAVRALMTPSSRQTRKL